MKLLSVLFALMATVLAFSSTIYAAPDPNNPNVVAYYEDGIHAIPLNATIWLEGYDLVMKNGNSGNFNQWFWNGDIGYHSVWNVTKNGNCANGVLIHDPNPLWGDYLVDNADYCVITNIFQP